MNNYAPGLPAARSFLDSWRRASLSGGNFSRPSLDLPINLSLALSTVGCSNVPHG